MSRDARSGLRSEINVTPLVDVVLVLLIIFMVIVPLTLRGYDVDIPAASADPPPAGPAAEQVVLRIDLEHCPAVDPPQHDELPGDCRVRLNQEELGLAELSRRTAEIFASRPAAERVLFLAAHDELNYEAVMRIVDAAKSDVAQLRIGIVTETLHEET